MRGRDVPVHIDYLPEPRKSRRGRKLLILIVVVVGILIGFGSAISYWVNLLWFQSLGYGDVFWTTLHLQWGIFALFAAVTFLILFAAFSALRRAHRLICPAIKQFSLGGRRSNCQLGRCCASRPWSFRLSPPPFPAEPCHRIGQRWRCGGMRHTLRARPSIRSSVSHSTSSCSRFLRGICCLAGC